MRSVETAARWKMNHKKAGIPIIVMIHKVLFMKAGSYLQLGLPDFFKNSCG